MRSPDSPPSGMFDALRHEANKQAWVDWLFARVAPRYDLGNDVMSLGWHTRWKMRLLDYAAIQPHHRVLDLACGTGDVTWMAATRSPHVTGTDINPAMMAFAETKRPAGADTVTFVTADAGSLPFDDESFDIVTCAYAGRGFPDWPQVLREVHRVLAPGGHFWNLDFARQFTHSRTWDRTVRGYMLLSGAVLGTVLHGNPKTYMYIPASMAHYPGQHWLDEHMRQTGFRTELIETMGALMAYNHGFKAP